MECFRIDESGYTGFDLLNADQSFQGAAAVAISNDDAVYLIKEHFPRMQAPELKYRDLARRPGNHQRLCSLLGAILAEYKCVTYICDKRFLLVLMFLEYAVEPYYYKRGLDFYKDGQNYALASLLYTAGSQLLGEREFDGLLAVFQRAIKEKTKDALGNLVAAARATRWQKLPEALGPIAKFAAPECLEAIASPGVTTDAAFVVLQALLNRTEEMAIGPYQIEHDQSKNLLTYSKLIQQYIDHKQDVEFRQSEIARLKFPLKLVSVTQVDSKDNAAVQLADVMIGAAIDITNSLAGKRKGGLPPDDVISLYADHQIIHLLPSIDFEEQKRFRKGTQAAEIIEYLAKNFGGAT